MTEGAGNASAANRAIHTVDPWPAHAEKTQINMDGKRALAAVRRYETNSGGKPKRHDATGNGGYKELGVKAARAMVMMREYWRMT